MRRQLAALIAAAIFSCTSFALPASTASAEHAAPESFSAAIREALTAGRQDTVPGGFSLPASTLTDCKAAHSAYISDDVFLYINPNRQLISRAAAGETVLADNIHALTHVSADAIYILVGEDAAAQPERGAASGNGGILTYPAAGNALSSPCEWRRISPDGSASELLMSNVISIPIVSGGWAYAVDGQGSILRSDLQGRSEIIYASDDGCALRLSPAPAGVICARYDDGLLLGCCAIGADSVRAVPDWAAGAAFMDGFALSYVRSGENGEREGLYIIDGEGERCIDPHGRPDWLYCGQKLYYWHSDPEQPYGFCDLMIFDPASGASQPEPAAAQLRAKLYSYGDKLYLENYDSELYRLDAAEPEPVYVMDLSVDYDFDSDLMPELVLYGKEAALGALIYLDEGDGPHMIGEIPAQ